MKLKCRFCRREFEAGHVLHTDNKGVIMGRKQVVCPFCGNFHPSSEKIKLKNIAGAKHIHKDY